MKTPIPGFRLLPLLAALLLMVGAIAQAKAEPLYLTIELQVDPARSAEFLEMMTAEAVATREFDGCRYFAILVDEDDPGRVLFYEIWDSAEDLDAYRAWRNETGFGAKIGPYMAGPPTTVRYTLVDD